MRPVFGFSGGDVLDRHRERRQSNSTSMVWPLRVTTGSAQMSIVVRSGPMPASDSAAATLTFAGKPAAASRAVPLNTRFAAFSPRPRCHWPRDGRADEPLRRLPRRHAHRVDRALGRGRHRVEPDGRRSGRRSAHPLARQRDQLRGAGGSAPALSTITLAGLEHRPADRLEARPPAPPRRQDGVLRQLGEGDEPGPWIPSSRIHASAFPRSRPATQASSKPGSPCASRRASARPIAPRPATAIHCRGGPCDFPVIPGLAEGESPEPITTTVRHRDLLPQEVYEVSRLRFAKGTAIFPLPLAGHGHLTH